MLECMQTKLFWSCTGTRDAALGEEYNSVVVENSIMCGNPGVLGGSVPFVGFGMAVIYSSVILSQTG